MFQKISKLKEFHIGGRFRMSIDQFKKASMQFGVKKREKDKISSKIRFVRYLFTEYIFFKEWFKEIGVA